MSPVPEQQIQVKDVLPGEAGKRLPTRGQAGEPTEKVMPGIPCVADETLHG